MLYHAFKTNAKSYLQNQAAIMFDHLSTSKTLRMIRKKINALLGSILVTYYKHKTNTKSDPRNQVAIMCDYLSVSGMLRSKELKHEEVGCIVTKRSNFIELLMNLNKIKFIIYAENYSDQNREELLAKCQDQGIRLVLIQAGDFMVPTYNFLNRNLNSLGNSETSSQYSLNKFLMRSVLNESGISKFRCERISSESDLKKVDFFPCVLKPEIGTGSEGVILIESQDELEAALKKSLSEQRVTEFSHHHIAEEYIEGRQFDVEGIVVNKEMIPLCTVEENYEGFFPEFDMNWYLFNAMLSSELESKMHDVVQNALTAAEIYHGAFHCELRIDRNGDVRILEFSNRMGGGFEDIISEVTGNNFIDLYIRSMLGKKIEIKENKNLLRLDKYFQQEEEFEKWCNFMSQNNIKYTSKSLFERKNIQRITILTKNKKDISAINNAFNLNTI